jgi:hypothetical protein
MERNSSSEMKPLALRSSWQNRSYRDTISCCETVQEPISVVPLKKTAITEPNSTTVAERASIRRDRRRLWLLTEVVAVLLHLLDVVLGQHRRRVTHGSPCPLLLSRRRSSRWNWNRRARRTGQLFNLIRIALKSAVASLETRTSQAGSAPVRLDGSSRRNSDCRRANATEH